MKKIKTRWLNFILHISAKINKAKEAIVDGGILHTLSVALKIVFLEALLLIVSLPIYIFISPLNFSDDKKEVQKYRLKRIISLVSVCTFIVIFLVTSIFSGGIFLIVPPAELRADSLGWSFDSPKDYKYDENKIQIIDGLVLFSPKDIDVKGLTEEYKEGAPFKETLLIKLSDTTQETVPETTPETTAETTADVPEETTAEMSKETTAETTQETAEETTQETAEETTQETASQTEKLSETAIAELQAINPLIVPDLKSWESFTEVSSKNGGEIYYQLSDDGGKSWYYYSGKWTAAGKNDYNTAKEINDRIKDFPVGKGQILFKAFFVTDFNSQMQLLDITIAFSQEEDEDGDGEEQDTGTIVANWDFNENSGSIAKDSVGNNNGSITGAGWTSGASGSALDFDGKGGHSEVPNSSSLNISSDKITLACWFKLTEAKDDGAFIFKNSQYFLRIDGQGRVGFILYNPTWTEVSMTWASRITDNSWHHTAGVYDGKEMKIYLDGQEIASVSSTGSIQSKSSNVWIGSQSGTTNQFDGILDEVQIYNKALSGSDVKQLYGSIKPDEEVVIEEEAPTFTSAAITGTAKVGETLTATGVGYSDLNEDPSGTPLFQWTICDSASGTYTEIPGAKSSSYTLATVDLGKFIKVNVAPTAQKGISPGIPVTSSATSAVLAAEAAPAFLNAAIKGTAKVGETLTASGIEYNDINSDLEGTPLYQWTICDSEAGTYTDIPDAKSGTYIPLAADLGKFIKVKITPTALTGTSPGVSVTSAATSAVLAADAAPTFSSAAITGTGKIGEALTAEGMEYNDVNGDLEAEPLYQWTICDSEAGTYTDIPDATESVYIPVIGDLGKFIKVNVTPVSLSEPATGIAVTSGSITVIPVISEIVGGLVSRWKLDENSGTTANDSVGGNNGSINNALWAKGVSGSALEFRGKGGPYDYIEIPDSVGLRNTGKFSVSVWVNATDISEYKYIVDKWWYSGSNNRSWSLNFESGKLIWRGSSNGSDNGEKRVSYPYSVHMNEWTHIAGIYDGKELQLYINGELVGTQVLSSVISTEKPIFIGTCNRSEKWLYSGIIDEISYYDRALSAEEIQQYYNATKPTNEEETEGVLVAKWKLDENSGTNANDSAGNNNGKVEGASWTTGVSGSALDFDGIDDYVSINNASDLNPSIAITVSAWVKWDISPASGKAWAQIVNKNGDSQYQLQHNANNSAFEFAVNTSAGRKYLIGKTNVLPNVWYFVVGTYDGTTEKLFVNGSLDSSVSLSGNLITSAGPLSIGRRSVDSDRHFSGKIDEVSIWGRALSSDEIMALYLENDNAEDNNTAPAFESATITGTGNVGTALTAAGLGYTDANGDLEATPGYKWMICSTEDGTYADISGAESSTYTPLAEDFGKFIKVTVTPTAQTGTSPGASMASPSIEVTFKKPIISNVSASQTIDTNTVVINYGLSADNDKLSVELETSEDGGTTWTALTEDVSGDIGPQVAPAAEKTISWDASIDFKGINNPNMLVRLSATGEWQNKSDYAYCPNFALDTKAPLGLSDFEGASSDISSIVFSWTPVAQETNFKHYRIIYGQNLKDVQDQTAAASVWDDLDDIDLSAAGTSGTIITGLSEGTLYYAVIIAVDDYGNQTTALESQFTTRTAQDQDIPPSEPILNQPTPNQPGIIVSGIADLGSDNDLYVDGELVIAGFAQTQTDGKFNGTIKLSEGKHEIYVISKDKDKNSSKRSNIITVDIFAAESSRAPQAAADKEQTGEAAIIKDVYKATESSVLQRPRVIQVKGIDAANNIKFTGTGVANSEVIVFIHSEQVIAYRVKVDENGTWSLSHSQDNAELAEGDHEVYALTLDAKSQAKSKISDIKKFQVKTSPLAVLFSYFDLPTTLLTIFVLLSGIVVFYIWRRKQARTNKRGQQQ